MRLFVRAVEAASFSKAAKLEGVLQSTASKQVAALEKRLGTQLLRRTSHGLSTTEAGREARPRALQHLWRGAPRRLGRTFLTVEDNGAAGAYATRLRWTSKATRW